MPRTEAVEVQQGHQEEAGLQGWRVIFFVVASFAFASGILVALGGIEPRNIGPQPAKEESHDGPITTVTKGIWLILKSVQRVFRIRSFQVILLVGIVETFHWVSHVLSLPVALHSGIMPQHFWARVNSTVSCKPADADA